MTNTLQRHGSIGTSPRGRSDDKGRVARNNFYLFLGASWQTDPGNAAAMGADGKKMQDYANAVAWAKLGSVTFSPVQFLFARHVYRGLPPVNLVGYTNTEERSSSFSSAAASQSSAAATALVQEQSSSQSGAAATALVQEESARGKR